MDENVIYRQSWKGKRTARNYELWIIPAGTSEVDMIDFIELPFDIFDIKEIDTGYEKRPLGMLKMPIMDIEAELLKLPDHTDYDLLRTIIFNPKYEFTATGYESKVQSGTLYFLFCNDSLLFSGIQQSPAKGDLDLKAQRLKIKVNDIYNNILKSLSQHDTCIKFLEYLHAHSSEIKIKNCYFNMIDNINYTEAESTFDDDYDSNDAVIFECPNDYNYYFAKREILWQIIGTMIKIYYNTLCRGVLTLSNDFAIQPPLTIFSKQLYDGTGGVSGSGSALVENQLYLLVAIAKPVTNMFEGLNVTAQNEWKGGYLDYKEKDGLYGSHTCLYDYLKDVYEGSLSKNLYNYSGLASLSLPIYNNLTNNLTGLELDGYYTSNDPINIDLNYSKKIEIDEAESQLKSVTSSIIFTVDDDIAKYDSKSNASQNDSSENLPIIFNNMPEAIDYEEFHPYYTLGRWALHIKYHINTIGSIAIKRQGTYGKEHINNIFYMDSSSPFTAENAVLVNPQVSTLLSADNIYTAGLPNCDLDAFDYHGKLKESVLNKSNLSKALIIDLQLNTCLPKHHADQMKQIFRSNNLTKMSIELDFDYMDALPDSFWLRAFTKEYSINLGELYPQLNYLSSNGWVAVNSKMKIMEERVELELINKTYNEA